ncbi:MAG: tetratricopeptide repeat protein [Candidatus Thorarchaeota archaeon]
MSESEPKDLRYAENLRREGKFQEALEVINNIEKKGRLIPADQLSLYILKGKILNLFQRHIETIRVGKLAYRLSQSLERTEETIISLLFKANCLFLGEYDKALKNLSEAEDLLDSLSDISPSFLSRQKKNILFRKSWAHYFKGEFNVALKEGMDCLELQEKLGSKSDTAYTLQLLGGTCIGTSDYDLGLDYATRSLTIFEDIGDQIGKATTLGVLGTISYFKGDLNHAIDFCKKSLSSNMISPRTKLDNIHALSLIYRTRGELDKALKYLNQGIPIAERENIYNYFVLFQVYVGTIYLRKGEFDRALEYLKPGLTLAEKMNDVIGIASSLNALGNIYLIKNDLEEVQKFLDRLKKMEIQMKMDVFTNTNLLLKSLLLIKRGGSRNRGEAEKMLRNISIDQIQPYTKAVSLSVLCEFYLEELNLFEDTEVLKEIDPLIVELYEISEEYRMYSTLAEAKLLQAKVALIQMEFEEAQKLLTQAQRVAELYGLDLLAQKISSEHDNYLQKLSEWKNLKEKDAPVSERLKLASVEDVLERLQSKRDIEPPELVEEKPIVLLIMDKSGISYFNHSFIENWDSDWLFSSFMSAFDTFSSALFSESIDRIKIGENLILINPLESFLVCYVIKGQSFPGLQKLNRFSDAIKNNTEIWESLNKAVKTGEVLELDKPQALGNVVNEIFIQ